MEKLVRRPWGMPSWLYWVLAVLASGIVGNIPFLGPLLTVGTLIAALVYWLRLPKVSIQVALKRPSVVMVNFRDLNSRQPVNVNGAYSYLWQLREMPEVGMRVWVLGGDGRPASAVIAALGQVGSYPASSPVLRVAAQQEIDAAHMQAYEAETVWLEMCRKRAGLPSESRKRKVPEGYPELAPVDGDASPDAASRYGGMWWRAFKLAEERGLPADEVTKFKSLAYRWYAIRDRG